MDTEETAAAASITAAAPTVSPYLGLVTDSINRPPAAVSYESSVALDSLDVEVLLVSWVKTPEGPMLWLQRIVVPRERSRVVEVLSLASMTKDETVAMDGCRYPRGTLDNDIFAIASESYTTDTLGRVRAAWKVDRKAARFVPITTEGLRCLAPQGME